MIDLNIIERGNIPADWLLGLKQYASVADDAQDMLLQSLLARAVMRVQEMADKSLIPCTFRQWETDAQDGVRLYQSVAEIVSVADSVTGDEVHWEKKGRFIIPACESVVVIYNTIPAEGDICDLLPVVYQYATALYDGQDNSTLANILTQCR
jgi:hypothetical protein